MLRLAATWVCVLVASAMASPTGVARAESPRRPGLNWVRLPRAESCMASQELAARVERRAGRRLFTTATDAEIFVTGHVKPQSAGGYAVLLQVTAADGSVLGERELKTPTADCRSLDEAIILIIAITLYPDSDLVGAGIALDPSVEAQLQAIFGDEPSELDPDELPAADSGVGPAPRTEPEAARGAIPHAPAKASGPTGAESGWRFLVDVSFVLGLGRTPDVGVGPALKASAASPSNWGLQLGFQYLVGGGAQGDVAASRVDFSMWSLVGLACAYPLGGVHGLGLCAGAEAGRIQAVGAGFSAADGTVNSPLVSLLLQASWRPRLVANLYGNLGALLGVALIRSGYSYRDQTGQDVIAYETGQFFGQFDVGLGLIF